MVPVFAMMFPLVELQNENEIKEITDDDISNVWYVKLAKQLMGQRDEQKVEPQVTEQP